MARCCDPTHNSITGTIVRVRTYGGERLSKQRFTVSHVGALRKVHPESLHHLSGVCPGHTTLFCTANNAVNASAHDEGVSDDDASLLILRKGGRVRRVSAKESG